VLKNGDGMREVLVEDEIYLQGEGGLASHRLPVVETDTEAGLPGLRAIVAETDIDLAPNLIIRRERAGQRGLGSEGDDGKHVLGGRSITVTTVLVLVSHLQNTSKDVDIANLGIETIA